MNQSTFKGVGMSVWTSYTKITESLSSKIASFAKWGCLAMMLLISYDVVSRYFFNRPVLYSDEISAYLIVFVCFLGAADTLKKKQHIIVDVITLQLPPKGQLWLKFVTHILGFFFLIVFTWGSIIMVYKSFVRGVTVPSILLTPLWIPEIFIPIGSILLCMQFVVEIGRILEEVLISMKRNDER